MVAGRSFLGFFHPKVSSTFSQSCGSWLSRSSHCVCRRLAVKAHCGRTQLHRFLPLTRSPPFLSCVCARMCVLEQPEVNPVVPPLPSTSVFETVSFWPRTWNAPGGLGWLTSRLLGSSRHTHRALLHLPFHMDAEEPSPQPPISLLNSN